ncbi:tubulin-like doman-containing protein [Halorientalis regularis]|uniref:Tubulin like n=1 Tax=Halorientalis regularis TaxID=660518 RepID=A0A1G7LXG2_9EURY|nr:tubulin-like doman-containing protein [Halorientalis regularis]SDF54064.1 Tubulin like [Halorientalis regularis]
MKFPDRIFAVGGAGKAIAMELLESEWVLRGILEPRPDPPSLTVTILDTAEGEQNNDKQRIADIRQRIAEVEEEVRDTDQGRPGSIEVKYKLVTEDIRLDGSIDLLGEEAVPRIAEGNGMDPENWWIKPQHINENLDFAKGVVRKRGLGKAIYYKAYAEDDQISKYIDLPEKGKVAVLAGLGGGTGSGILADLAQHLKERHRTAEITLFGVLPNHLEGLKENTNAFAALSELEYLSLTDEQVFKDRILLPIDPTEFDGKTGNRIQTDRFLEEFDEAVVYMLASYYNTEGLEDPFADAPKYAPFTIGIPQILRYNVEAINEARQTFRGILDEKQEALQAEEEIYTEIDRHLDKHFGDGETGLRDLDRTDLNERIERVTTLLEFDLFNELNYESIAIFEDIIEDAKEESSDVAQQVDTISASVRAIDATSRDTGQFVDNIDEHLAEIIEKDLTLIAMRKEILSRIKTVDDKKIRDALEFLIGTGSANANPGVRLQRLESELEDLEDRREQLETELEEAIQELEDARDAQSEEVKRLVNNWERNVENDVARLQKIARMDLETDLNTLRSRLDEFLSNIVNADTEDEVEQIAESGVRDALDRVQNDLNEVGIDFQEDRRAIEGSLSELKQGRVAFFHMNQEEGTIESIAPWQSSTEEEKEQAHKDYRMQNNRLDDRGIFSVGPPGGQFTAELTYNESNVLEDVEREERTLRDGVLDQLREQAEDPPEDLLRELETSLTEDPDKDQLRDIVRRVFRLEVGETDDIEERRDKLQAELTDVEDRIEVYDPTIDLFQRLNNKREVYEEQSTSFRAQQDDYSAEPSRSVSTESDRHVYIKNMQPEDVFRATGREDLAQSDLLNSREETQRVRANLEELAKNARNEEYTSLKRRKLSRGRSRYSDMKVRVSVLSRAISQLDSGTIDVEDIFTGAFDIGSGGNRASSPYTSWASDVGGPWDIGICVFISGVFLDNIKKAVQADGYFSGYQQRQADIGDDILVHHSYGLSDGYYVRRKNLMNMEDEDDVAFFLRDEPEITQELLDEYIEMVQTSE